MSFIAQRCKLIEHAEGGDATQVPMVSRGSCGVWWSKRHDEWLPYSRSAAGLACGTGAIGGMYPLSTGRCNTSLPVFVCEVRDVVGVSSCGCKRSVTQRCRVADQHKGGVMGQGGAKEFYQGLRVCAPIRGHPSSGALRNLARGEASLAHSH